MAAGDTSPPQTLLQKEAATSTTAPVVGVALEAAAVASAADPRVTTVVHVHKETSRLASFASCVGRRAMLSSVASNGLMHRSLASHRSLRHLLRRPMEWTQIGTWTLGL
jgi:hypothetical protein